MSGTRPSAGLPTSPLGARSGAERPGQQRLPRTLPSWARAFPGTARQAATARRFVTTLLDGSPLREDAALVTSELFANAVLHTDSGQPGGLVIVQVSRWRLGVRIAVTDQGSRTHPVVRNPADHPGPSESGTGLFITTQIARHLGWHDDPAGRTICTILGDLPPGHEPRGRPPHPAVPAPGQPA